MRDLPQPELPAEIARRRTFAIISHPDAGKTTLTEKFLLFGGAIQMAGQVRAKGEARRTRSDFMQMEKDRGISVSASAMSFDFGTYRFNLVDTPGHSDFSEDTYRTLTAVDAAIMVIDGAKGVESQTRKLFEVCRLRDLPILTFCNKMDREARDTFEIIDEIQENLAIDVTPASWPIGMGRDFLGCYDMLHDRLELMDRADRNRRAESIRIRPRRPEAGRPCPAGPAGEAARGGGDGARAPARLRPAGHAGGPHDADLVRLGHQLLRRAGADGRHRRLRPAAADPPGRAAQVGAREARSRASSSRSRPTWTPSTATAWPSCASASGHFERGMKLHHVRAGKPMAVSNPVLFLAADRELAEDAWAGDIIGIPNHGQLRIGDTLTEGEDLRFTGIPSFAPELLQTVRAGDPMKAKHLDKALMQFAEEGAAKVFKPHDRLGLHRRRRRRAAVRRAGLPDRAGIRPAGALRAVAVHLGPLGRGAKGGARGLRRRTRATWPNDHDGDPVY
jgi:peptide chain release factor 3